MQHHTTQRNIKADIQDATLWSAELTRDYVIKEDASFSHAFGVEERYEYLFAGGMHRRFTLNITLNVSTNGTGLGWLNEVPDEVRYEWNDSQRHSYDAKFHRILVCSYASLIALKAHVVTPQSTILSLTYEYYNELEEIVT